MSECLNVVKENKKQSWCVESRVCLGNYAKLTDKSSLFATFNQSSLYLLVCLELFFLSLRHCHIYLIGLYGSRNGMLPRLTASWICKLKQRLCCGEGLLFAGALSSARTRGKRRGGDDRRGYKPSPAEHPASTSESQSKTRRGCGCARHPVVPHFR